MAVWNRECILEALDNTNRVWKSFGCKRQGRISTTVHDIPCFRHTR
ncbi:hypothetical protein RISK_002546 [Rhodopirellula islandica]|uniref:Uncharacterized protein n=1 Tax=Rhodopirellula islandica TaxID=595434 RepID=A0A0J1EIJ5_RHOIS|nr:hypothetical protein RISK_002546 [Rhodopirellula islandica]